MLAIIKVNLLRRWGRTTLTCVGVAVGVTTVVALLAVTRGLSRSAGDLPSSGVPISGSSRLASPT